MCPCRAFVHVHTMYPVTFPPVIACAFVCAGRVFTACIPRAIGHAEFAFVDVGANISVLEVPIVAFTHTWYYRDIF